MKRIYHIFFIAIAAACISSCKKTDISGDADRDPSAAQKPEFAYNVYASKMLDLVNEVRVKGCNCGTKVMPAVEAVTWNDLLGKAAYVHSEDMATNNYFSHDTPAGETAAERVTAQGYIWTTCGENIASGQPSEEVVMNSWLNSEGHCKNIMRKEFKEMGAGRSGNYWTQVFGTR